MATLTQSAGVVEIHRAQVFDKRLVLGKELWSNQLTAQPVDHRLLDIDDGLVRPIPGATRASCQLFVLLPGYHTVRRAGIGRRVHDDVGRVNRVSAASGDNKEKEGRRRRT